MNQYEKPKVIIEHAEYMELLKYKERYSKVYAENPMRKVEAGLAIVLNKKNAQGFKVLPSSLNNLQTALIEVMDEMGISFGLIETEQGLRVIIEEKKVEEELRNDDEMLKEEKRNNPHYKIIENDRVVGYRSIQEQELYDKINSGERVK